MRNQLAWHVQPLKGEYENEQKMMADLQARLANLQETHSHISRAIQVLEEELDRARPREPAELEQRDKRTWSKQPEAS